MGKDDIYLISRNIFAQNSTQQRRFLLGFKKINSHADQKRCQTIKKKRSSTKDNGKENAKSALDDVRLTFEVLVCTKSQGTRLAAARHKCIDIFSCFAVKAVVGGGGGTVGRLVGWLVGYKRQQWILRSTVCSKQSQRKDEDCKHCLLSPSN